MDYVCPYTPDELQALTRDAEFQRRIGTDKLLDEYEHPQDEARDAEESARALDCGVTLAGVYLPPPRLGHIRLLATIGSDFTRRDRRFEDIEREVMVALFVLHFGRAAVEPVANRFRYQRTLAKYAKDATGDQLAEVLKAERALANELAHFDNAVNRFALTIKMRPDETMPVIAVEIDRYCAAAWSGLNLIPRNEDDEAQKKTKAHSRPIGRRSLFDWLASVCRRSRTTKSGGKFPSSRSVTTSPAGRERPA